jgi:hypothetical protein
MTERGLLGDEAMTDAEAKVELIEWIDRDAAWLERAA